MYTCSTYSIIFTSLIEPDVPKLLIISNNISLSVGEATILTCVGFGIPSIDITWSLNGDILANSSIVSIYEEEITTGGRNYVKSFLELCSLMVSNSGTYTCIVANGPSTNNGTLQLSVTSNGISLFTFMCLTCL